MCVREREREREGERETDVCHLCVRENVEHDEHPGMLSTMSKRSCVRQSQRDSQIESRKMLGERD